MGRESEKQGLLWATDAIPGLDIAMVVCLCLIVRSYLEGGESLSPFPDLISNSLCSSHLISDYLDKQFVV